MWKECPKTGWQDKFWWLQPQLAWRSAEDQVTWLQFWTALTRSWCGVSQTSIGSYILWRVWRPPRLLVWIEGESIHLAVHIWQNTWKWHIANTTKNIQGFRSKKILILQICTTSSAMAGFDSEIHYLFTHKKGDCFQKHVLWITWKSSEIFPTYSIDYSNF